MDNQPIFVRWSVQMNIYLNKINQMFSVGCEECMTSYDAMCPHHRLQYVPDKVVLSRAWASLPPMLQIFRLNEDMNQLSKGRICTSYLNVRHLPVYICRWSHTLPVLMLGCGIAGFPLILFESRKLVRPTREWSRVLAINPA